ncbi:MAG: DUF445 family protein [Neisseriaceae bacterium]|jgi:uncharacterized membrane protein YheB (UPF0754 family)|nr:MAG: DUF445 family protein [Neisseriaceae bacterium]
MWDALLSRAIECLTGPDRWSYIAIPFVGAFIGWFTNWKAIKLTFYPKRFIGIPPYFGWQGIVPRKAEKMAGMAIDIILTKLLRVEDIFARLDPKAMAEACQQPLNEILPKLIGETIGEYAPDVWENLPLEARNLAINKMLADAPQVVADILEEIRANPSEVLDLRTMVVDACKRDVSLLNRVFLTVGKKEFRFIELSGLIFGIPFGIVQMLIWFFVQPWWFLTVGGALAGGFINWLAIVMIFNPKQPRRFGPFVLHGLFMRRQKEVAEAYSKMVAEELLNPQNIIDAILKGPLSDGLFRIVSKHVKAALDRETEQMMPFMEYMIGTQRYIEMKNRAVDRMMAEAPAVIQPLHDYSKQVLDIENTLRIKLESLPVEDFEDMLHPVFKEDEWILIALGVVLGGLVGYLQWHLGF